MSVALSSQTRVEEKLGYLPAYYLPTLKIPSLFNSLWQQQQAGYLHNPLPSRLKEKLLVYLSQGRNLSYAVVCHSCQLYHLGLSGQGIFNILQLPYPSSLEELTLHYRYLGKVVSHLENWQEDPTFHHYLLPCCWLLFHSPLSDPSSQLLRHCLGEEFYGHLIGFIAYIQGYHQWLASYPQISYHQDPRTLVYLPQLLEDEPDLEDLLPLEGNLAYTDFSLDFDKLGNTEAFIVPKLENLTDSFSGQSFLAQSFDQSPHYVYLTDVTGQKLQSVNQTLLRAFGKNIAENWQEQEISALFSPTEAWELQKQHQQVIEKGHPVKSLEAWTFADGIHHLDVVKLPLKDEKEIIQGILVIAHDVTEWVTQKQELSQQNQDLEAINQELEAFSYAVSHDLCAPLRAMDGFSQVLYERYSDSLDQKGQHYLQRIRANCQRMGELIEDLLELSRVSRYSFQKETVNLSLLALEVKQQLQEQYPQRSVILTIDPQMRVNGDVNLLKIVLENLLGNAWKYTAYQETAKITLGYCQEKQAFFVEDNGVGFDMAYVHRLFGAFQRLHSEQEFSGNGIGLATVSRIIHRHGGRIWAEGEVEKGATFYFILP